MLAGTPVAFRESLYLVETDDLIAFLRALPEAAAGVLVIGHNPACHDIAVRLVGKADSSQRDAWRALKQKFPTGALCSIACDISRWSALGNRTGTLTAFIRPRDLAA